MGRGDGRGCVDVTPFGNDVIDIEQHPSPIPRNSDDVWVYLLPSSSSISISILVARNVYDTDNTEIIFNYLMRVK